MKRNKGPTTLEPPPEGWGDQSLKPFSFLLPPGHRSSSRVVPDTPTNTPKFLVDSPGVTMVLETPEDPMEVSEVMDGAWGGPEGSLGHTSNGLGMGKLRRRKIMSFLESDFSNREDVRSPPSDNNAADSRASPKDRRLWSRVLPGLGTPRSGRQRRSIANIIVPSDLNDEDFLATKLSHIQQEEESDRARRRSSACSSPRQPALTTPEMTNRHPYQTPTRSRARQRRTSVLGTPQRSEMVDRGTTGCTTATATATTPVTTTTEDCNATILFDNEDLQLTPAHCRRPTTIEPDRQTTTTTTTCPSPPATSNDTGSTEDSLKRLQTCKSPLLQLRKFNTAITQKMAKELEEAPRTRKGEGMGGAECRPLILHSTPQRKDRTGSTGSVSPGGSASLPSPAKDPSDVLKDVVAYVDVRVDGENRSAVIKEQLGALGAKVETRLTRNTTHVIFRDGSKAAFLRARDRGLHILSTLWVEACRVSLSQAPETSYPSTSLQTYSSDIHIPKKFKRSVHVKDIEEDLKLVEARIRRRNKKNTATAATPPTKPIPTGYCTPRYRPAREDVNSPLYSIRHLLSPHLKESWSTSCGEEEEEDDEDGICTPLAKRLFKKFMARQEAGREKGGSQEQVVEAVTLRTEDGAGTGDIEDQESLKLHLEGSDSFSRRTSSEVVSEGDMPLPQRLTEETHESAGRPGGSHSQESGRSLGLRLDRNSSEVSQEELTLPKRLAVSCTLDERQGGAVGSCGGDGGGGGGGGGGSVGSDSSGCVVETPVVARRLSVRVRAQVSESEGFGEDMEWMLRQNDKKNYTNTHHINASTHEDNTGANTNLDYQTKPHQETNNNNKNRPFASIPTPHTTNDSPSTHHPTSAPHFPTTQRTLRRLMDLENDIVPTQDLITPSTPKDKRTGPYHHLLHPQATKTKKKRLSRELFTQKSSHVSPSTTAAPSTTTAPSTSTGSSSSASDKKEHKGSSSDDSVFGEARIVMLPRARRSTEEFKMVNGRPKPKGGVKGGRGRKSCPPSRLSPSSSSSSSASLLCLTSLHSSDKRTVLPIIRKLGGYRVGEAVTPHTSHVVCGEPRRTLNLLLGIARGCWVVDVSWVYRSLEDSTWVSEEPFELVSFAPGAKACREKREAEGSSYQHTLFSKVGGVCVMNGSSPPPAQLKELLELCGATVVSSIRDARVVVGGGGGDGNTNTNTNTAFRRRRVQVTHVSEKWVLDSIQHHKLHPLQDYILS